MQICDGNLRGLSIDSKGHSGFVLSPVIIKLAPALPLSPRGQRNRVRCSQHCSSSPNRCRNRSIVIMPLRLAFFMPGILSPFLRRSKLNNHINPYLAHRVGGCCSGRGSSALLPKRVAHRFYGPLTPCPSPAQGGEGRVSSKLQPSPLCGRGWPARAG